MEETKLDFKPSTKTQKRIIEVIEFEDGSYTLKGFAYELPLRKDEVLEAFESWFKGSLEKRKDFSKELEGGKNK